MVCYSRLLSSSELIRDVVPLPTRHSFVLDSDIADISALWLLHPYTSFFPLASSILRNNLDKLVRNYLLLLIRCTCISTKFYEESAGVERGNFGEMMEIMALVMADERVVK